MKTLLGAVNFVGGSVVTVAVIDGALTWYAAAAIVAWVFVTGAGAFSEGWDAHVRQHHARK